MNESILTAVLTVVFLVMAFWYAWRRSYDNANACAYGIVIAYFSTVFYIVTA